ncbi:hypothetical protein K440DRAFT_664613 [Wilcoxina mikolae CBS 423.85]|nr:hypothetical protein K440DRAFT_664613 [Wilcoxina mikolae CBS 423.85]
MDALPFPSASTQIIPNRAFSTPSCACAVLARNVNASPLELHVNTDDVLTSPVIEQLYINFTRNYFNPIFVFEHLLNNIHTLYSARDEDRMGIADRALRALIMKDKIIKGLKEDLEKERKQRKIADARAQGMAATMSTLALELGIGLPMGPREKAEDMEVDEQKEEGAVEDSLCGEAQG